MASIYKYKQFKTKFYTPLKNKQLHITQFPFKLKKTASFQEMRRFLNID